MIGMPELISYLEKNGFYPRREDIESILRRLDHDANRMISYEEYCELASITDTSRRPSDANQQQNAAGDDKDKGEELKDG